MSWFKITAGARVYVLDPQRLQVRGPDGEFLSPSQIVDGWRQLGEVEQLAAGVDPEQVMRDTRRPPSTARGGNMGVSRGRPPL